MMRAEDFEDFADRPMELDNVVVFRIRLHEAYAIYIIPDIEDHRENVNVVLAFSTLEGIRQGGNQLFQQGTAGVLLRIVAVAVHTNIHSIANALE